MLLFLYVQWEILKSWFEVTAPFWILRRYTQTQTSKHLQVQQDRDIISAILKINSILIPLILCLNTDLNILATCFKLTVTTDFVIIYI
jgi:hypothetical protein